MSDNGRWLSVKSRQVFFYSFASKNRLVPVEKLPYILPDFHSRRSIKDESCAGIGRNGTIQTSTTGKYLVVSLVERYYPQFTAT